MTYLEGKHKGGNEVVGRYGKVSVDVVIPTYRPDRTLEKILGRLKKQTYPPDSVIIFNTEKKYWPEGLEDRFSFLKIHHIRKKDFDHGGTRHEAACTSEADIIIFMTQDAVPAGNDLIENLIKPIVSNEAKISYARQLANKGAGLIERTGREFNYPPESRIKSIADADELGIKTFFCSDVCAAYDRNFYMSLGGFPRPVIFNEDMIFAGKALDAGEKIAYAADACVYHSHDLSAREQFKRNFDLGVSQADHADFFDKYPAEGEGKQLIKTTAERIKKEKKYHLLFSLFWSGACRYVGYRFGKKYKKLPMGLVKRFSSDPGYFDRKDIKNV